MVCKFGYIPLKCEFRRQYFVSSPVQQVQQDYTLKNSQMLVSGGYIHDDDSYESRLYRSIMFHEYWYRINIAKFRLYHIDIVLVIILVILPKPIKYRIWWNVLYMMKRLKYDETSYIWWKVLYMMKRFIYDETSYIWWKVSTIKLLYNS